MIDQIDTSKTSYPLVLTDWQIKSRLATGLITKDQAVHEYIFSQLAKNNRLQSYYATSRDIGEKLNIPYTTVRKAIANAKEMNYYKRVEHKQGARGDAKKFDLLPIGLQIVGMIGSVATEAAPTPAIQTQAIPKAANSTDVPVAPATAGASTPAGAEIVPATAGATAGAAKLDGDARIPAVRNMTPEVAAQWSAGIKSVAKPDRKILVEQIRANNPVCLYELIDISFQKLGISHRNEIGRSINQLNQTCQTISNIDIGKFGNRSQIDILLDGLLDYFKNLKTDISNNQPIIYDRVTIKNICNSITQYVTNMHTNQNQQNQQKIGG